MQSHISPMGSHLAWICIVLFACFCQAIICLINIFHSTKIVCVPFNTVPTIYSSITWQTVLVADIWLLLVILEHWQCFHGLHKRQSLWLKSCRVSVKIYVIFFCILWCGRVTRLWCGWNSVQHMKMPPLSRLCSPVVGSNAFCPPYGHHVPADTKLVCGLNVK